MASSLARAPIGGARLPPKRVRRPRVGRHGARMNASAHPAHQEIRPTAICWVFETRGEEGCAKRRAIRLLPSAATAGVSFVMGSAIATKDGPSRSESRLQTVRVRPPTPPEGGTPNGLPRDGTDRCPGNEADFAPTQLAAPMELRVRFERQGTRLLPSAATTGVSFVMGSAIATKDGPARSESRLQTVRVRPPTPPEGGTPNGLPRDGTALCPGNEADFAPTQLAAPMELRGRF